MANDNFELLIRNSMPDSPSPSSYVPQAIGYQTPNQQSILPSRKKPTDIRVRQIKELQDQSNRILEEIINSPHQSSELQSVQTDTNSHYLRQQHERLTYVLIDGNNLIFCHMINKRSGSECAEALTDAMQTFSRSQKLRIQVFANIEHLARVLELDRPSIYEFVRTFNDYNVWCNFIDVGHTPESSRKKITSTLDGELDATYCRYVVLGIPFDQHYTASLNDIPISSRTRLGLIRLKGASWTNVPDYIQALHTVSLDSILLPIEDLTREDSTEDIAKGVPVLAQAESPNTTGTATTPAASNRSTPALAPAKLAPPTTWASMAAQTSVSPAVTNVVSRSVVNTHPATTVVDRSRSPVGSLPNRGLIRHHGTIERNRNGERIDRMDKAIPYREVTRVKNLKLCNIYYLQGSEFCDGSCRHSHTYKLSSAEKLTLREVARMTPCHQRTACDDPTCIYGHRCPQSKTGVSDCYYGDNCRFVGWGHGIDERVVKATKV